MDYATSFSETLTDSEIQGLKAGKKTIFIFGVVQYMDIFEKYHETGYCAFHLPSGAFMNCAFNNWLDKKFPNQE